MFPSSTRKHDQPEMLTYASPIRREAALNVLLIEDDEVDQIRVQRILDEYSEDGIRMDCATTLKAGRTKMAMVAYDCVLLDIHLPDGDGMNLLCELSEIDSDSLPAIILQTMENDPALGMKAVALGAQDYLVKDQINGPLLIKSIRYAIQRNEMLREKKQLVHELQEALQNVDTLQGLLPICSGCKSIRNDEGYWQQVEDYFTRRSAAQFSHGICPDCVRSLYADLG